MPPIASFARLSRSRASDLLFLFRAPVKADTHEGFCSRSMLLRVYQRFHGYTSSSGAEFPPYKMFHDIQAVKYLGSSSRSKLSELENAPSCLLTLAKWAWSMLREQNPSCVSAFKLPPTQDYWSFRYNFIQSTCKLFHLLGLRNEEYSPKTFSCSHASYTWSDRNFCPVSALEFVSKRPRYWDAAILSRWDTGSFIFSQMLSCCFRLNTETTHHKKELRRRCLGE